MKKQIIVGMDEFLICPQIEQSEFYDLPNHLRDLVGFCYEKVHEEAQFLDIDYAEFLINNDTFGFVRIGIVANVIRHYKSYTHKKFKSFKDWCERGLKRTHWHIKRLIQSAVVVMRLIESGFRILPNCEAQCRPLVKLSGAELTEKWQQVVDAYPPERITASAIEAIVNGASEPKKKKLSISTELAEKLAARAAEAEMSVEELLEELLAENEPSEPDPDAIARWEEDLQQLIEEQPAPPPAPKPSVNMFDRFIEEMEWLQAQMGLRPPIKKSGDSS